MNMQDAHPDSTDTECQHAKMNYLAARRRLEDSRRVSGPDAAAERNAARKAYDEALAAYNDCRKLLGHKPVT